MAVFLIIAGMVMIMAAINDQIGALGALIKGDLFGGGGASDYGFVVWAAAIIAIGAVLRVADLPDAGRFLVALVIIAYLLGHAGIPTQVLQQIQAAGGGAGSATPGGPGGAGKAQSGGAAK